MTHAQAQLLDRTLGTDLNPLILHRTALAAAHAHPYQSVAVLLATLPNFRVQADESNGNQLWGICREGYFVTTLLRRSSQRATPHGLRVDLVIA